MPSADALAVHLDAVSYRYPQSEKGALSEVSYTFPAGTTAIVGPNGAGKSTLVKLLTGLLTPTSGSITVQLSDGRSLPPENADKAVLFQEPSHLHLTVRQNVTMRFERTPGEDARIHHALELAGLSGVVEKLPDGIDTLVGAGFGGQLDLSGGQWQRLALARLIYQDSPVMILDEPVASLDPEGERAVFELFTRMTETKVILFTTHRYDSIPEDTNIVVLVDGRIAETGTHEQLIQRQRHYWSLWTFGRRPAAQNGAAHNGRARAPNGRRPADEGCAPEPAGQRHAPDIVEVTPCDEGFAMTVARRRNEGASSRYQSLLTTAAASREAQPRPEDDMYADAVAKITESIFPIFYVQPESDLVGVCGTGFFIDDSGLFLTSEHVMAAPPAGSTLYFYGKTPDEVCEPAVEIEHVASDPSQDLYLGRVPRDFLEPAKLSHAPVRPGDSVCLSGYPLAVLDVSPEGGLVGSVRRYWQPTFVIDATYAVIDGRTYDGYIVQHSCFPGMSGGPVFDVDGHVRGMASATFTRTIPPVPGEAPTVVSNAIVIDVEHLRRFLAASGSWPSPQAELAMDRRQVDAGAAS
jgi:ABC-type multidrug transport system ATPase subunit